MQQLPMAFVKEALFAPLIRYRGKGEKPSVNNG